MNFEIENKNNSSKKKNHKKAIITSMFFIILAAALIVIYFVIEENNKKGVKTSPPIPEEKQIKIVDENSNERPVAVMIDNNVGNNKHAGLQDSYINYEIIVEGGLTRIMAVYKDKDVNLIGPVRSSRHYFLDYALESDAIYTHYGWSPYAKRDITELDVDNINGLTDEKPFWRDKTIAAPHNVFTSTERIRNYAKTKQYKRTSSNWKLFKYSADEINLATKDQTQDETDSQTSSAISANTVNMTYSPSQTRGYTYDSENKYYLRKMNGLNHVDKTTGQTLHFKNIIIEKVENTTLDSYGRQDLTTNTTGEGFYITDGYAIKINWTKSSRSAKTKYKDINGNEIKLNDGNTFVQIVPLTSNITIS